MINLKSIVQNHNKIQSTFKIMSKRSSNQPKQFFSLENNEKPKYTPKVQPRKSKQKNLEWIESNNFQSQANHHVTQNDKQTNDIDIDRLDLIFKKEPRDIQQKLMKLLISYNAVMKYVSFFAIQNKDTDMFEVDLFLPFLNEQQKKHFIKQFLQVRQKQNVELRPQRQESSIEQESKIKEINQQNDQLYGSKQLKKFSFNIKQYQPFQDQQIFMEQNNVKFTHGSQVNPLNQISANLVEPMSKTGQFYDVNLNSHKRQPKNDGLNLSQIDNLIAFKLKNAISVIRKNKEQQKKLQGNIVAQNMSKTVKEDSSKQQQSIIDQISNPSFNNTQNASYYKQLSVSQYIKEDQQVLSRQAKSNRQVYFNNRSHDEQNYTDLQRSYMQIEEQPYQEQDYEPLFKKNQDNKNVEGDKNKKMISFQDYAIKIAKNTNKKKTNLKNQRQIDKNSKNFNNSRRNEVMTAKQYESTKIYAAQHVRAKQTQRKQQDLSNRNTASHKHNNKNRHSPISKESRKIQNQVEQFFNTHQKKLDTIYSQIKDKINQRQQRQNPHQQLEGSQKLFQKLYILVQDQAQEEDDKGLKQIPEQNQSNYFREQMLKQYHKQILVNNRNLSSQELVKYFKFLHSNAKRIYIKYLQNKNK